MVSVGLRLTGLGGVAALVVLVVTFLALLVAIVIDLVRRWPSAR